MKPKGLVAMRFQPFFVVDSPCREHKYLKVLLIIKTLFLVVSVNRIVDGVVETTALLALDSHAGDEITYVDHVAKLAKLLAHLHTLEEVLGLLIEQVETVPGTLQSEVASHDAHIVAHAFAHFLDALGDEHLLLVGHAYPHRSIQAPCR